MARSGTINMRRWPRSSVQLRATQIVGPGTPIGVLTTMAASARPASLHSSTKAVLVTVGVHPRPLTVKTMSFAVRTTAAAYDATGGTAPLDHDTLSRTVGGAHADTGYGVVELADENGDPILDENGFPILVQVQGITKNSDQSVLVTGAVHSTTFTIPTTQITTAVLTTFGGSVASVTAHQFSFAVETTVGVADNAGPLTHGTPISVATTGAADQRADLQHNTTTASENPVGAFSGAGAAHIAAVASQAGVGAVSGADVTHNTTVAVATTAGVYTFGLLPAFNAVSVSVLTTGGAAADGPTVKAALPSIVVTGAAGTFAGGLVHDIASGVVTTLGAEARVGPLEHNVAIEHTSTFVGAIPSIDTGHEVETVSSITFAGVSADAIALHEALAEALTTGAAHAHWNDILIVLCLELSAVADNVTISVDADTVSIAVEAC